MNILLLSMPDSFEHMPSVAIRMPNGALASLAGNVDPHHRVAVADLILVSAGSARRSERLVREIEPDVVGLSVMTFQRHTALRSHRAGAGVCGRRRAWSSGGYDASLAPDAYTDPSAGVDFIVRGEGELTFRELVRAIERRRRSLECSRPLVPSAANASRTILTVPVSGLDAGDVRLPNRGARVLTGYTMVGRQSRRRRDLARVHVRLQLLLDHRDARAQLPHVRLRRASWRTSATRARTARGRSSWSTTTSR